MDEELTICITHYNKIDRLKETIRELEDHTPPVYHIKLFNNGYRNKEIDQYLSKLEGRSNTTVIYNEENVGPPASRRALLKDISTPYVMTLDDDMYVCEGWYDTVMNIFQEDAEIGFVGVPFYTPGSGLLAGSREIEIGDGVIHTRRKDFSDLSKIDDSYVDVEEVPSGCMVLRTECLDAFTFDPNYFVGFGDIDKTLQIRESDWKQVMCTGIRFAHDNLNRSAEYKSVRRDFNQIRRSYLHFMDKWELRYPLEEHLRFKYVFAIPNPILQKVSLLRNRLGA